MKTFHDESVTGGTGALDDTAQLAIETGARLMRVVRRAIRSTPPATISLNGLRTLGYLLDTPGACLSEVAEHLLVGVPTASKLVDDLAGRGYLTRGAHVTDRRRITLTLTAEGEHFVSTAARPAQEKLAELLARLPANDHTRVREGLALLRDMLAPADRGGCE